MTSPMRIAAGVNDAVKNSTLWNFPKTDPTKTFVFFDDFHCYYGGDWTVTEVGTGSRALVADEPFGALALTCGSSDNDAEQIQLTTENFTLSVGKRAWFKTRFKVSDATQSDVLIGLAVLDTTLQGSTDGDGVTDGIFFSKEDGDTQWDVGVQKNTSTGQLRATNIATVTTNYVTLGFEWDGKRYIKYFVDDVQIGTLDLVPLSPVSGAATDYLPDTPITISASIVNGEAVAKVLTIDYIFAAIER